MPLPLFNPRNAPRRKTGSGAGARADDHRTQRQRAAPHGHRAGPGSTRITLDGWQHR